MTGTKLLAFLRFEFRRNQKIHLLLVLGLLFMVLVAMAATEDADAATTTFLFICLGLVGVLLTQQLDIKTKALYVTLSLDKKTIMTGKYIYVLIYDLSVILLAVLLSFFATGSSASFTIIAIVVSIGIQAVVLPFILNDYLSAIIVFWILYAIMRLAYSKEQFSAMLKELEDNSNGLLVVVLALVLIFVIFVSYRVALKLHAHTDVARFAGKNSRPQNKRGGLQTNKPAALPKPSDVSHDKSAPPATGLRDYLRLDFASLNPRLFGSSDMMYVGMIVVFMTLIAIFFPFFYIFIALTLAYAPFSLPTAMPTLFVTLPLHKQSLVAGRFIYIMIINFATITFALVLNVLVLFVARVFGSPLVVARILAFTEAGFGYVWTIIYLGALIGFIEIVALPLWFSKHRFFTSMLLSLCPLCLIIILFTIISLSPEIAQNGGFCAVIYALLLPFGFISYRLSLRAYQKKDGY
jgi:hypothetical protein